MACLVAVRYCLYHSSSGRFALERNISKRLTCQCGAAAAANWDDQALLVSQSFLEETTAALSEVVVPASKTQPPESLREFHPTAIDGKTDQTSGRKRLATAALVVASLR